MKFKTTGEYLYWWPIKVKRPSEERSGQWVTESFEMQFLAMNSDEARALAEEIAALPAAEREAREHDQLLAVCRNWRGVVDEDKNGKTEIPFSAEMLTAMLKAGPWYRLGIYQSYAHSLIPDEARKGN